MPTMTASKGYDDFLTSTYTELGLDLGAVANMEGASGGALGLGLGGMESKEWEMDVGAGQEFLDFGACEGDGEQLDFQDNTTDGLLPSPGPSPIGRFNNDLLTPDASTGVSPASTTAAQPQQQAQTVDPSRVSGAQQAAGKKGNPINAPGLGMFGLGGFPAMPLSPPYDSSAGGSLAESASERGADDLDESEDEEMSEVQVKQEAVDPVPAPRAAVAPAPTLQLPTQTPQQRDAFAMLGLSQEQQQQIIQQLLASLTGKTGVNTGVNANAFASSSKTGIRPATVMAPPAATPALTNASSFTPTSTTDSRRPSMAMSSNASSYRGESSTPPPQQRQGGKGKGRATGERPGLKLADPKALVDAPLPPLPALFGGLKGKGGKKGGGMSSVVIADGEEVEEDDIWRPTAEEYKNLSSKEKRQLRNKLSARAFRNRRKDYIGELEEHIKDRDRLIEAIRSELKNARGERDELRSEINALKKAAMVPTPAELQQPRPSAAIASPAPVVRPPSPLNMFNPNKDVPSSAALAGLGSVSPNSLRNAWSAGTAGGYTPVHTALVPDITLPQSMMNRMSSARNPMPAQVNLNPLLNKPASPPAAPMGNPFGTRGDGQDLTASFDDWTDGNQFSHKNLEAYRMQLWSRMARDSALAKAGVPVDQRPRFFKESSLVLADKDEAKPVNFEDAIAPTLGNIVQGAITTRLFSAFISAFQNNTKDGIDGAKVSAVFTGKSQLAIVPTEPSSPVFNEKLELPGTLDNENESDNALARSFASLHVASQKGLVDGVPTKMVSGNRSALASPKREACCLTAPCLSASFGVFNAIHRPQAAR